ncbi:MAG: DUF349 domain-containing protein [Gammaproteobacteria bacterium]
MSRLSDLFGKSTPAGTPPASEPKVQAETPPPDPVAQSRDEEASVLQDIAAGEMAAVGKWALEGSSTRVRQLAAQAITDLDQLRELIRATRGGNDKNVHRILIGKRDALLAEIRSAQQLQSDIETVSAAIRQHARFPWEPSYADALEQLDMRWRTLAPHAAPDVQSEVAQHLQRARQVVEHHREAAEAQVEQQRSAALAAEEARRQRELAVQAAAAVAAERARRLDAERHAEQEKRGADEAEVRSLLGLLRQATAALDQGGTARAARFRDAIAAKLPQAPALPAWFARQLEDVETRLAELQDWKTFTVVPKRAKLVQQMQSLIGAEISAEELAQRIRRLRDEWRTLHRGAGEEPAPERLQFQEAATRAYEPCREHFARQAARRQENEKLREALLQRLTIFATEQAGEATNWRVVQQVIVEARREWGQYAPVSQAAVKPLQARFYALVGDLRTRLEAEHARNVKAKRDLIARAAELVGLEDTRSAIEESKSLQRTWKNVGPVPRLQDKVLWEEFRQHCDAVFKRSAQESAAYGAALDANEVQATALCENLERIAELTGEPLASGVKQLNELRTQFEALELPRVSARNLHQRFSRATHRCGEAMRRDVAVAARRGWTDLFSAAAQVRAYALATALEQPPANCETLRASAASAVADLGRATPKAGRAILEQQLSTVAAGAASADLAANEAALRLLCIRAELNADAPTPSEDLALRREYQLQRLVESMGRGERVVPVGRDDLALEWIAVGPVESSVHDVLFARFERCRDTRGKSV